MLLQNFRVNDSLQLPIAYFLKIKFTTSSEKAQCGFRFSPTKFLEDILGSLVESSESNYNASQNPWRKIQA